MEMTQIIEMSDEFTANTSRDEDSIKSVELTPVTKCCLKKKCYERVLGPTQNELFNNFWRIGDYAKQNYFLVGLMAAQTPKQKTSHPMKKNKSLSWKYWVDIRGRKVQVCKGFFLAVYGVSDKRLRVLQTKLVNGDPLEDQRGKYDKERRANQHTVKRKLEEGLKSNDKQITELVSQEIKVRQKSNKKSFKADLSSGFDKTETVFISEIILPANYTEVLETDHQNV